MKLEISTESDYNKAMIETLKTLVLKTASELNRRGLNLTTAESCTGGGLSYWLTSVPGSSAWFERGFVTYSNAAKNEMLGVSTQILNDFGAVSKETAQAMAIGALEFSKADISIAITGIAGPDGGSPEKPVGTVWIAWTEKNSNLVTQVYVFSGDRQAIRLAAMIQALEGLLSIVLKV